MNSNQLYKCLKKSKELYHNIESYSSILKSTANIKLDISNLTNPEAIVRKIDQIIKNESIALPFDDMFFDIKNYDMPNLLIGSVEKENIGFHLQCLQIELKKDTYINVSLIQDYRKYINSTLGRSYLAYSDPAGLHIHPMIDKIAAGKGCKCWERNFLNNDLKFSDALAKKTPTLKINVGYSLPDCAQKEEGCKMAADQIDEVSDLFKIVLGIMIHPKTYLVKVFNKKKDNNEGFLMLEEEQINELDDGIQLSNLTKSKIDNGEIFCSEFNDDQNEKLFNKTISHKAYSYLIMNKTELAN